MRRCICVPMMLLLLLIACGKAETAKESDLLREPFRSMTGCTMEAEISCVYESMLWAGQIRCTYVPAEACEVVVLAPKTIAGVRAILLEDHWQLEYEDTVLAIPTLGVGTLSPMTCLPRLMHALREGWLQEENGENWGETSCVRLSLDESTIDGGKILSTLWLDKKSGLPLRGEIALNGEIILVAEFTAFTFYDKIEQQEIVDS